MPQPRHRAPRSHGEVRRVRPAVRFVGINRNQWPSHVALKRFASNGRGMMTRKNRMVPAGGILCLIGLMTWVWLGNRSAVRYRTMTVDRGDVNVTVSANGNPNAVVTVQ